ncbi:MAG: NADPH-dependent oxidoreductase [Caldilineae bacterium]|nr:MAG: NADPH-dependent oxidoreductase [Caldilineae bacterium]
MTRGEGQGNRGDLVPVHIAAICGSMRGERSYTRKALELALHAAQEAGATVDLIDLAEYDLPWCNSAEDTPDHPHVVDMKARVTAAQGILLGSPEYHNSYSGVLKNALDLMGGDEFRGKVFGLLGVAGGSAGAINTLGHLRVVVRGVGGWSLPVQISIPNVSKAFQEDQLVDQDLAQRIRFFGRELVRFTRLHSMAPELEHRLIEIIDEDV